jgi:hypothetical protein
MRSVIALSVVVVLASVGCKKNEDKSGKGNAAAVGSALSAAGAGDLEAWLKDEAAPLSPEIEEKLLLGLKDCNVTESGIDPNCEGLKRWQKARGRKTAVKGILGGSNSLGAKYITHESPAIRYKAADLMGSIMGADAATQKIVVEAANKEQVPAVLANMIQTVGSKVKGNDDVKALLMKGADHSSERVRTESLGWFLSSFGEGVPGGFEKASEKLASDPSVKVRASLCSRLYGSKDDRAIPLFEKYLNDKATPDELYKGCWNGVVDSWTGYARPDKPSQKGYELTMKVLEATPRSKERPPWSLSTLGTAKTEFKADDSFGNKWFEKVKPWYKKERLLKALEGIAVDPNAYWMARSGALDVMKELAAPKVAFERVQKKYEKGDKGDDSLVKKKVDDIVKAL